MTQIEGVSVNDRDAWWLIDRLRSIGRAEDATAAFTIESALTTDTDVVWLTPAEKQAVMRALAQHPVTLIELRNELRRNRHGGAS